MDIKKSGYIAVGSEQLHYTRYGTGSRLLIAFHGYGDKARLFELFEPLIQDEFTMISVSLPHHGDSSWPDDRKLQVRELEQLVNKLTDTFGGRRAILMGYSMVGRVCLKIAEVMPTKVKQVVLLASDGLRPNALYSFVTRNLLGKVLFRSFLLNTRAYMPVVKLARSVKLIDQSRYKFAMRYLHDEGERKFLLKVWPCMSLIIPDYKVLKKNLNKYHIHVDIFMGFHDRVIPLKLAEQFSEGIDTVNLKVLKRGHQLLDSETARDIVSCLLK